MADDDAEQVLRQRVGLRIKAAREAGGLTQAQVAQRVGMARPSIANLEAGRQDMNISRLALVAAAVNLDIGRLILPEDLPELPPPPAPPHEVAVTVRRVYDVECETCQAVIATKDSRTEANQSKHDHIELKRRQGTELPGQLPLPGTPS